MFISTPGESGGQSEPLQAVKVLPPENFPTLKMQIRHALNELVELERQEAAAIERQHQQKDDLDKAAAYIVAGARGLFNVAKDTALWVKDVYDLVSPDARRQRIFRAVISARQSNDAFLPALKHSYLAAEKREFIEVIGFDPTAISDEQYNQAALAASLVWEDPILRTDITRFAKNYAKAQHGLEITEMGGGAAFEIALGLVLAAFTAGAGIAIFVTSKARHAAKFKKVGKLLLQYAKSVHAHTLKKANAKIEHKLPSFSDFEVIDDPGKIGTSEPPKGKITQKNSTENITKEQKDSGKATASNLTAQSDKYAELVNSNKPWSWQDFPEGELLTVKQKREIRAHAIERGLIPDIPYKPGTKYPDFEAVKLVERVDTLPEELWKSSDYKQFKWLDSRIPGGRPKGYTWHHSEVPGRMELVPFGPHNSINHKGGRSKDHWADAKR
jgi:hypothetical protein